MKQILSFILFILFFSCVHAQEKDLTKLPAPRLQHESRFMAALSSRQSMRTCAEMQLPIQDLSDVLWAANGINRLDGKRTAPSTMNRQEVDVYVFTAEGAFRYLPESHSLQLVAKGDHRAAIASRQDFVLQFPVSVVLVSDLEKLGRSDDERTRLMAAVDVGCVCQNICLCCSALGLATVPRATMDEARIREILHLSDTQLPLMNNPIGLPAQQ